MITKNEKTYTSTEDKLVVGALERLVEFKDTGMLKPQSLQLAPTDVCAMDCVFCSTKYRNYNYTIMPQSESKVIRGNKKTMPDIIMLSQIKPVLDDLISLGALKTVELTGAGDSIHHPEINELISYLASKGLEIGMITHGMGLTKLVTQENLDKLAWLRVSLASFDPQNFHGNNSGHKNAVYIDKFPNLPESIKGKLGFSYVWGPNSRIEILDKIADYAKNHQVDFVRIVPDCLDAPRQKQYRDHIMPIIDGYNGKLGKEVLFFQAKRYDVYDKCRIGFIKPYLNADGYFYHCSAVPLYNQAFTPHWRMGHMGEVKKIWQAENIGKFNTSHCEYGKCFYAPQNELLDSIAKGGVHKNFI